MAYTPTVVRYFRLINHPDITHSSKAMIDKVTADIAMLSMKRRTKSKTLL